MLVFWVYIDFSAPNCEEPSKKANSAEHCSIEYKQRDYFTSARFNHIQKDAKPLGCHHRVKLANLLVFSIYYQLSLKEKS